jgi:type I restriction enzyme S subunit
LCISQDSQGIIFDKKVFNLVYLANCLSILALKFVHQNQGTAIKGILKDDLEALEILCPPLSEQNKIAEILSTWDRAIETLDKLIEAKNRLKKGLMQKLLTGKV